MTLARRATSPARFVAPQRENLSTIGDLAREFGVSLRTLRFYEDRGLISPLRQGAARLYTDQDRARLQMILKGKRLGFTLTEIRDMVSRGQLRGDADNGQEVALALPLGQIVAQIDHLERQRRDLDEAIEQLRATHAQMAMSQMPEARASHVG